MNWFKPLIAIGDPGQGCGDLAEIGVGQFGIRRVEMRRVEEVQGFGATNGNAQPTIHWQQLRSPQVQGAA